MTANGFVNRRVDSMAAELADLRREVAAMRSSQVRYVEAAVSAVNVAGETFTITVHGPDGDVELAGVGSSGSFMPGVGDTVTVAVNGAQPIYHGQQIGENAVGNREIAPSSIDEAQLSFVLSELGGTTIFYSPDPPVANLIGDVWLKDTQTTGADGSPLYLIYRWSGVTWMLLQDQKIALALLGAIAAQETADSKVKVYTQAVAPTGVSVGDVWIDTGNGNRINVWGPTGMRERTNHALNPSFEYDAAGTLGATGAEAPTSWAQVSGGTTGTRTASIVASGATYGTKVAKIVGGGLSTLNTAWIGYRQTILAAPGDVLNLTAYYSFAVTSASQRAEWQVEWLNVAAGVISTLTDTTQTAMSAGGSRTYAYSTAAAPALTVQARITLRRRGTLGAGGSTVTNADLSIDAVLFEKNRAADAPTTYFDGSTGGEAQWSVPSAAPLSTSITWQEGSPGANAWRPRQLRTGSFQPGAIIASNVLATGTVTATLLEALMVLTTALIAGPVADTHAELSAGGLLFFAPDPEGGMQGTGGFGPVINGLAFVDPADHSTTLSLTDTGDGVLKTLSVAGYDSNADDIPDVGMTIYGRDFSDWINDGPRGIEASGFYNNADAGIFASGITTAYGLGEISFTNYPDRQYLVIFSGLHYASTVAGDRGLVTVRGTTNGAVPTISNGAIYASSFFHIPYANQAFSAPPVIINGTFSSSIRTVRLLVTLTRFSGTGTLTAYTYDSTSDYVAPLRFAAFDVGPNIADNWIANDGGGVRVGGNPSPDPKSKYVSTWGPSFVGSYYGDGTRRTDTPDMVQGYTPYYPAGGNQKALVGFTGNAISGETTKTVTAALSGATVTKVEIYAYAYHSYYNSGGNSSIGYHGNTTLPATAPAASWGAFSNAFFHKPEGRWMTLPSATFASWANGTYRGFTVGPGISTADDYYLRFYGGGSLGPRLRITYTR